MRRSPAPKTRPGRLAAGASTSAAMSGSWPPTDQPDVGLFPVPGGLDVLQDQRIGRIRWPAGRNGAFEEGSIRVIAVVTADAKNDARPVAPLLGRVAVVCGRHSGRGLRVSDPDGIFPRTGLDYAEGIRNGQGRVTGVLYRVALGSLVAQCTVKGLASAREQSRVDFTEVDTTARRGSESGTCAY